MTKVLVLTAIALALWAATPVGAQSLIDTHQQKGDSVAGDTTDARTQADQPTRAAQARGFAENRDVIGNQPPAERSGAGAGGR